MFEVVLVGNRRTWQLVGADGRALVYTDQTYDDDGQAAAAAKAYRSGFWAVADQVDHRMARCI